MKIKTNEYEDRFEIVITIPKNYKPINNNNKKIQTIINESCETYGIDKYELNSYSKTYNISRCRQQIYFNLQRDCKLSLSEIARIMGRKGIKGISYGIQVHKTYHKMI